MKDRTLYVLDAKTNLYTADEKRVKGIFYDILHGIVTRRHLDSGGSELGLAGWLVDCLHG